MKKFMEPEINVIRINTEEIANGTGGIPGVSRTDEENETTP